MRVSPLFGQERGLDKVHSEPACFVRDNFILFLFEAESHFLEKDQKNGFTI